MSKQNSITFSHRVTDRVDLIPTSCSSFDAHLGSLEMIRNTRCVDQTFKRCSRGLAPRQHEYSHVEFNELRRVGTLGVGGFGRVELVQFKNKVTFALKCLKKIEMLQQQQQEHAYNEKEILFACDSVFIVR